ncbi:MAG: hypothetical protein V3V10_01700 [Planctomycetota bacterium]
MMQKILIGVLLLLPLAATFNAEELTTKSYKKVRDSILPTETEKEWRKIEWQPTFWDGVIKAQKDDKPIMLYAMNGHPFGCT